MPEIEEFNNGGPESVRPLSSQKTGINGLLVFLIAIFVLAAAGSYAFISQNQQNPNTSDNQKNQVQTPPQTAFSPISPHMIVYGTWSENLSNIKAYDLSSGKTYILAKLPSNVKKVSILSPSELIYIANTNDKDHGTEVALYNISTKQSRTVFKANIGFGIDDYVLSSNKRYLVDWEVSFIENSNVLREGRSQVYSVDLSNSSLKNLIYDELANAPVHYPRAVTDSGEIYLDTFLPNSGAGWAYGMSVSNFNGSSKEDLTNMQNGTYGTQPSLSPDGKYLAFAGYEGADGKEIENGNRKAILNPNTLEIFNTLTKERVKISPDSQNRYLPVSWDRETGNFGFITFSKQADVSGFYLEDITLRDTKKIPLPQLATNSLFISSLSNRKILYGELNSSLSTLGNLGKNYSLQFTKLSTFDSFTSKTNPIDISENLIQYIDLTPGTFFTTANLDEESPLSPSAAKKTLQLQTFALKPKLASERLKQQSHAGSSNDGQGDAECKIGEGACLPTSGCISAAGSSCSGSSDPNCASSEIAESVGAGECTDSPLYLYGSAGQKVKVTIGTPVFSSSPLYNNEYDITLLDGGKMQISGGVFERITYDYATDKKIVEPNYGTISSRENLADVLSVYASKLGLNSKETQDLIEGTKNIYSPYIFVSFFNNKTSKEILPISFEPNPEVYINIVFYLKGLKEIPTKLPKEPVFVPSPFRTGFTAIETSWVIR